MGTISFGPSWKYLWIRPWNNMSVHRLSLEIRDPGVKVYGKSTKWLYSNLFHYHIWNRKMKTKRVYFPIRSPFVIIEVSVYLVVPLHRNDTWLLGHFTTAPLFHHPGSLLPTYFKHMSIFLLYKSITEIYSKVCVRSHVHV